MWKTGTWRYRVCKIVLRTAGVCGEHIKKHKKNRKHKKEPTEPVLVVQRCYHTKGLSKCVSTARNCGRTPRKERNQGSLEEQVLGDYFTVHTQRDFLNACLLQKIKKAASRWQSEPKEGWKTWKENNQGGSWEAGFGWLFTINTQRDFPDTCFFADNQERC
jgi:hypothetical protein